MKKAIDARKKHTTHGPRTNHDLWGSLLQCSCGASFPQTAGRHFERRKRGKAVRRHIQIYLTYHSNHIEGNRLTYGQASGPVSQTVRTNAPDRKGEGRIVLPEAQKKLLSRQLRGFSMSLLCLVLILMCSVQAFAVQSVDNPPDSADVAAAPDEDTTEYEQYNSILFSQIADAL